MEANARATLSVIYEQFEKNGYLTVLNWKPGKPFKPRMGGMADMAKWIEAASYALATRPDKKLERRVGKLIEQICLSCSGRFGSQVCRRSTTPGCDSGREKLGLWFFPGAGCRLLK